MLYLSVIIFMGLVCIVECRFLDTTHCESRK